MLHFNDLVNDLANDLANDVVNDSGHDLRRLSSARAARAAATRAIGTRNGEQDT